MLRSFSPFGHGGKERDDTREVDSSSGPTLARLVENVQGPWSDSPSVSPSDSDSVFDVESDWPSVW